MFSSPTAVTTATLLSFFVFYSLFDKSSRTLAPGKMLPKVFHSTNAFLREMNKILALAGLTLVSLSVFHIGHALAAQAALLLATHAAISALVLYGGDVNRLWFRNRRMVAIMVGQASLGLLLLLTIPPLVTGSRVPGLPAASVFASIGLGGLHFFLMELSPGPYTGSMECRPYGYVALAAAVTALVGFFGFLPIVARAY